MHLSLLTLLIPSVSAGVISKRQAPAPVCLQIAGSVAGNVYYNPGETYSTSSDDTTPNPFTTAITHWMTSSSQTPLCVVEVKDAHDISAVLKIIGSTRTPFAVRSAGYTSSPGFSSTTGVHISLEKIKQVLVSGDKSTVEVGLGNSFTEVYTALNGSGVNVLGAHADGPGTGGVTLSGGYSWYTNQYGLGCDTVVSYELVLPTGLITQVNASQPDLFFALKGGVNRFGIVTKIVFKAVPNPGKVYGGIQIFDPPRRPRPDKRHRILPAQQHRPKSLPILTLGGGTLPGAILLSFYDGPERPSDFDIYNNISSTFSTLATRDYSTLISGTFTSFQAGNRGSFASFSTSTLTASLMAAVVNETQYWSRFTKERSAGLQQYDIEPFHAFGKFATESAYPHADSPLPLNIYLSWTDAKDDAFWNEAIQLSLKHLTNVAKAEGILIEESIYPGYAYGTTGGDELYGKENAARLRHIRAAVDPEDVMLLAGGFTI